MKVKNASSYFTVRFIPSLRHNYTFISRFVKQITSEKAQSVFTILYMSGKPPYEKTADVIKKQVQVLRPTTAVSDGAKSLPLRYNGAQPCKYILNGEQPKEKQLCR